jgi:hypothetical protein
MERQNEVARALDLRFARDRAQIREMVESGELVPLDGNEHYQVLDAVSNPVARPAVKLFVQRLAEQYYGHCGEQLVVTSLTRTRANQPRNAHPLSVHPAGIAIDFRISQSADCRTWLEATLLALEDAGVLDVTRERRPPHYHVAVFPEAYRSYVAPLLASEAEARAREIAELQARLDEALAAEAGPGGVPGPSGWTPVIPIGLFILAALWQSLRQPTAGDPDA